MEARIEQVIVARRRPKHRGPLISFSGLEGSCKTSLSLEASQLLRRRGWRVRVLRSYPLSFYSMGDSVFTRVEREDMAVRARTKGGLMRLMLRVFARLIFIADLTLVWMTIRGLRGNGIALIFDRYAYDALVQLRHTSACGDGFVKRWSRLIPKPDVAFWLRTRPEVAHERRPEYTLDECASKADIYRQIAERLGFCVVDTENEKMAREEIRGILAYAERNW